LTPRGHGEPLLDHLVGTREHLRRNVEAERPGGGQVHDEIEFGRLLDRNEQHRDERVARVKLKAATETQCSIPQ
jgi:hypothetical protein